MHEVTLVGIMVMTRPLTPLPLSSSCIDSPLKQTHGYNKAVLDIISLCDIASLYSALQTSSYYDIMYPAWSFWSGGPAIKTEPTGLGRWDMKRLSITKCVASQN